MKELVDIISAYLALTLGIAAFWWGLFRSYPLEECLVKALVAMAVVYAAGLLARFVMAFSLAFGGKKNSREKDQDDNTTNDRTDGEGVQET